MRAAKPADWISLVQVSSMTDLLGAAFPYSIVSKEVSATTTLPVATVADCRLEMRSAIGWREAIAFPGMWKRTQEEGNEGGVCKKRWLCCCGTGTGEGGLNIEQASELAGWVPSFEL